MVAMQVKGLDVVVKGLEEFGPAVQEAAFRGVIAGMEIAYKESLKLLGESDHSLRDLAAMGHPYSKAHGFQIHDPDETVHRRDGTYRGGLKAIKPTSGSYGSVVEGKIVNTDPKDRWIQDGTTRMRARPWMAWVIKTFGPAIGNVLEETIEAAIKKAK